MDRAKRRSGTSWRAWYLGSEWLSTFCPTVVITDTRDTALPRALSQDQRVHSSRRRSRKVETRRAERLGLERAATVRQPWSRKTSGGREAFKKIGPLCNWRWSAMLPCARLHPRARYRRPACGHPRAIRKGYHELRHCFAYIHATEAGDTRRDRSHGGGAGAHRDRRMPRRRCGIAFELR
jgi:hypothetical protein